MRELVSTHSPLMPIGSGRAGRCSIPGTPPDYGEHAALRWVTADGDSPGALTAVALKSAPPNPVQALTTNDITAPARPAASQPGAQPMTGVTTRLPEAPIPLRVAPIRHPSRPIVSTQAERHAPADCKRTGG